MDDELWRQLVNKIPELTEGTNAPQMEQIPKEKIRDGESPVMLQKIITEVYVYTSTDVKDLWYGSQTFQEVQVLGQMRLSEALKQIQSTKSRRRRKNS